MVEQRIWRGADGDLFRFTTTELRELHLAVMSAFEEASVLAPALNLDQVRVAVDAAGWDEPLDDDALIRVLGSLAGWGLLEATQDHGASRRADLQHRPVRRLHDGAAPERHRCSAVPDQMAVPVVDRQRR